MLSSDLPDKLREAAAMVFRGRGVLVAYAYGSRVSGRPLPESDLDVGYYLDGYRRGDVLPVREEMLMAADLSDALGLQVDLRNLAEAPLELRGRVLEDGVRIFSGDNRARVELECYVLARYHDYKEIYQQMHEIRLRRTAPGGS